MLRGFLFASPAAFAVCLALASQPTQAFAAASDKDKAEMAGKVYTLLKDKCYSCHGEPGKKVYGEKGGLNYILDYDKLISNKLVIANDPEGSSLYTEISSGSMPRKPDPNGGRRMLKEKLAQDEIELVKNWIKEGAPKWGVGGAAIARVEWKELRDARGPGPRSGHAMSEGPSGTVVLFGGNAGKAATNDTWVFNGSSWSKATTKNSPPAVAGAKLCFDKKRGVAVLVGAGSVWEFDGKDWMEVKAEPAPPARQDFALAFDLKNNVTLMFGGKSADGSLLGDLWSYDGKVWKQLESKAGPEARCGAAMAFSPASKSVLLFGGATAAGAQADTWLFDGKAWAKQSPAVSPKAAESLLAASSTSTLVLVASTAGNEPAGIWLWDGKSWTSAPAGPASRMGAALALDGKGKGLVLYGGKANGIEHEDTWSMNTAK